MEKYSNFKCRRELVSLTGIISLYLGAGQVSIIMTITKVCISSDIDTGSMFGLPANITVGTAGTGANNRGTAQKGELEMRRFWMTLQFTEVVIHACT